MPDDPKIKLKALLEAFDKYATMPATPPQKGKETPHGTSPTNSTPATGAGAPRPK